MTALQSAVSTDPRLSAFLSPQAATTFATVVHPGSVWRADPFDVESIHADARQTFADLLARASGPTPPEYGRIFLLRGVGGSGKTHLLRSFRQFAHTHHACAGYVQMISQAEDYSRYILSGLIDALDRPYLEATSPAAALQRIARGVLDSIEVVTDDERKEFCEAELDTPDVVRQVERFADFAMQLGRYDDRDLDLIRGLLYLLPPDRRLKSRVMKWMRCEELIPSDRSLLGGLAQLVGDGAAMRVIAGLGRVAAAALSAPLVLLVDQIEEVFDATLEEKESGRRFRQAVDTLVNIAAHIPTAVVVVACVDTHYEQVRQKLPAPKLHRLENETPPVTLRANRELGELEAVLAQRLRCLAELSDTPFDSDDPLFPFRRADLAPLAGQSIRGFLLEVAEHQRGCAARNEWCRPEWVKRPDEDAPPPPVWPQRWNDFLAAFTAPLLDDEGKLTELLAFAVARASDEMPAGVHFGAEASDNLISVDVHPGGDAVDPLYVALCDKNAKGGGLGKQVQKAAKAAGEIPLVFVRSTPFPTSPTAVVSKELAKLLKPKGNGRKVVVSDSDWRAMAAFRQFHTTHHSAAGYAGWRKADRPLAALPAVSSILALDELLRDRPASAERPLPPPPPPVAPPPVIPPVRPISVDAIPLGNTRGASPAPVELRPNDLCRHAAFLGGPGSGKTTAALAVVEHLLMAGVPAVLLDRKGDLARYADPAAWTTPEPDPDRAARRARLKEQVDVKLWTPGADAGRPLAIPVVPDDMAAMSAADREQTAQFAAAGLCKMMGYKGTGPDPKRVIVQKAIEVLARTPGRAVTLRGLRELVAEQDKALVHETAGFDEKHFKKLGQDLLALAHQHRRLLDGPEVLDVDALLGRGLPAGRTRLAVLNTQFLGDADAVDFWVSQLLLAVDRWRGKNPSAALQAVFVFDEADKYLPASGPVPATKGPMEGLLRRARSAGLGLLLASQSPGDFDYRCRDQILTWFVGKVTQEVGVNKLKPLLERRPDAAGKLAHQKAGEFYLVRESDVLPVGVARNLIPTEQVPEDRILALARGGV